MALLEEVEKLNKEIEKLMTEKTKADAQKEVWKAKLKESMTEYKKVYGVDLMSDSISSTKLNLEAEYKKVESEIKEEYEKAQTVVELINEGKINEARQVMGLVQEEGVAEEQVEEKAEEAVETKSEPELQGATEVYEELENADDDDFFGKIDDSDLEEEEEKEEEKEEVHEQQEVREEPKQEGAKPFQSISFDDDDDDDFVVQNSEEHTGDFDANDDFGGFGGILKGSKFDF